jgi:hypothetical protein
MSKIYYQPEEVWDALNGEAIITGDLILLAENVDFGVEIYAVIDDDGVPSIVVEIDDDEPMNEEVKDEEECFQTVSDAYEIWLDPNVLEYLEELDSESKPEDEIQEREEELDSLVDDFITQAIQDVFKDGDYEEVIKDVKEHFLAYLYRKHGISPYRPMMVINDKGDEEYAEYPYPIICS